MVRAPRFVTTQNAIIAELRDRISRGVLRPGDRVHQDGLAADLGVSIVPVREALKALEAEGQLAHIPNRGYFVTELDLAELREAYLIRRLLEDEAVRVAVPRLGAGDVAALVAATDAMAEASSHGALHALVAANRTFHFRIYETSGLPRLVTMIRQIWDATEPYRAHFYTVSGNRARAIAEHREIIAAVIARDAERTVRLLAEHRDTASSALATLLSGPSPLPDLPARADSRHPHPG